MSESREFRYEIPWSPSGNRPGHHHSLARGAGFRFREHVPLLRDPDARRIDLHATLRDPRGEITVRAFRERRAITVNVLADTSASMAFGRKWQTLVEFCEATAYSAYRTGDAFAFQAAAERSLPALSLPASRTRGAATLLSTRLRGFVPAGRSNAGLLQAASNVGRHASLVFIASDFHCPTARVRELLETLARHAVIPVVVWDAAEFSLPRSGWHEVADMESGHRRTVWLRPRWRASVHAAIRQRQSELQSLFSDLGLRPLALTGDFDAHRVTEYFAGAGGWPDVAA